MPLKLPPLSALKLLAPKLPTMEAVKGRHIVRGLLLIIVGLPLLAYGMLFTVLKRTVPDVDGKMTLPGLSAEVKVIRDDYGVPHIFAASRPDAWMALGYVHAQDRMFQMEMQRRFGAGRLAETIGPAGVKYDKLFRTLGIYGLAEKSYTALAKETQDQLTAYAAGVNAWLEENSGRLPFEYTLLGFKPEPWKPADTLVWGKLMAWKLSANLRQEAYRGRLSARYDRSRIEKMFPKPFDESPVTMLPNIAPVPDKVNLEDKALEKKTGEKKAVAPESVPAPEVAPAQKPAITPPVDAPAVAPTDTQGSIPALNKVFATSVNKPTVTRNVKYADDVSRLWTWEQVSPLLAGILDALPHTEMGDTGAGASNEWAIGKERTATGGAILANDPHLELGIPILWYLARITTPEGTLAGATAPGTPLMMLGQNEKLAWAITTTNSDTQDLFIETIDPESDKRYLTLHGSEDFLIRDEVIKVKGEADITYTVRATRHGPVMSDLMPEMHDDMIAEDQVVALAWTGLSDKDTTFESIARLNNATHWLQFVDALKLWVAPTQNVMMADKDGNIGYVAAGLIPARKAGNGRYPVDGASGAFDWVGVVPFTFQPQTVNPAAAALVNANNAVVQIGYPYWLGTDVDPGWRARRIEEMIGARAGHDVASVMAMQLDVTALHAREFLPYLLRLKPSDEVEQKALALLTAWEKDHQLKQLADRPEALILEWWLRRMNLRLLASELDDVIDATGPLNASAVLSVLRRPEGFCRDKDADGNILCTSVIQRSFREAVAELAERYGDDPSGWRWGNEHTLDLANQVLDNLPLFKSAFGHAFSSDGGFYTVNRGGNYGAPDARHPLIHDHGAGFRGVYDMADPARSRFIITTGQSGHPLSRNYADLLPLWRKGEGIGLFRDEKDLMQHETGVLRFLPDKKHQPIAVKEVVKEQTKPVAPKMEPQKETKPAARKPTSVKDDIEEEAGEEEAPAPEPIPALAPEDEAPVPEAAPVTEVEPAPVVPVLEAVPEAPAEAAPQQ